MNENQEIIELLKSINKHLEELDEAILEMKTRVDRIDDRIIQEKEDEILYAELKASNPEEFAEEPDPQLEEIGKALVKINKNLCVCDDNQRIRHDTLIQNLNGQRDEELSYCETNVSHMKRIESQLTDSMKMLKTIHDFQM